MVKRIHRDTTWILRGMYFQHHVIFTWNPRYISNLIHVDSTTVYERMSTRKSTWILCCLSTWQRRGFYGLFLSGFYFLPLSILFLSLKFN